MNGRARNQQTVALSDDGIVQRVRRVWGESPFYQMRLNGPAPDRLISTPEDPFTPDTEFAESFLDGRISLGSESLDFSGDRSAMWARVAPGNALYDFLHEFSWLRHMAGSNSDAREASQLLMQSWLERYEVWSDRAWQPYLTAERLVQLCAHHRLILKSTDALWRSRVLTAMARQTRHLALSAPKAETGFDRLMSSLGLCIAGYCLPGCEAAGLRGLEMAHRELRLQIRSDGGHVSRNPSRQLKLAVRLQQAISAMDARGVTAPGYLRHAASRVSAMTLFFRVGDGKLAVFNGGYEDDPRALLYLSKAVEQDFLPSNFARHSGYHRLSAGRSLVLLDTGNDIGPTPFKGAGSLQFSAGRSRIFVNCGNGGHRASEWRTALASAAAHSGLSYDESEKSAPQFNTIKHWRAEDDKGRLVEFERTDGTDADFCMYRRRIFLSSNGGDFRGEEVLTGRAALDSAVWRFHLHPTVRVSIARDQRSAILMTTGKEGWQFKSNCKRISLEKSIYCGEGGTPIAGEQLVIQASDCKRENGDVFVRWALRRLDPA